jgi:tetratricopeptide (TPR) repeat protein
VKIKGFLRFLAVIAAALLSEAGFTINPVPADTAKLNRMAREAIVLLHTSKSSGRADSLIGNINQLTTRQKIQPSVFMLWANGELAVRRQEYGKAYEFAAKAMKSAGTQLTMKEKAELTIFFARTCQYTGQFSASIDNLNKAAEFVRSNHIPGILPSIYYALSEVYTVSQKNEKIEESLEMMLQAAKEENNQPATKEALYKLGKYRLSHNWDFKTVDHYMRQSLEMAFEMADTITIAAVYVDMGWNYILAKKPDSALYHYEQGIRYAIPGRRYYSLANAYGNMGTIYRDLGNYEKAVGYWKKGIETAKNNTDWYTLSWIYADMSKMAKDQGKLEDAYKYQVQYKAYSDSLAKQQNKEGLAMAQAKFDADTIQRKLEMASLQIRNQRLIIYGFAIFLVLTITIGLLLLRQAKLNAKRKISEMDQKILEVTQANLRQQMNPHFIFNTLNSIQYYMYKHDKLATNNYLTKFSSLMRKILENSRHTAIPIRDELDALQLYLELESIRFRDKFDYEIVVDEEIDPLMYKIPTMLIQPYVENAICHGLMYRDEKGKVSIALGLAKDHILCTIEDNRIGREASREINRSKEKNHNSLGTQITESRLNLVSTLYGKDMKTRFTDLKDEQGNAAGTRVEIQIPILT